MSKEIIKREIASWIQTNPYYKEFFNQRFVKNLVKLCGIVTLNHPYKEKLISDYIAGLTLYPIYIKSKNEQYGKKFAELVKPVMDLAIEHVKSDDYRKELISKEISGDAILKVNGVESRISPKEILMHSKRIKVIPLVPKDIAAIERDWIEYKRKQYSLKYSKPEREINIEIKSLQTNSLQTEAKAEMSKSDFEKALEEIKSQENQFWKGLPMEQVIKHFEIMTKKKNKNGDAYLSLEQFISFLKRGFLNDKTQTKQKIICSAGEKGLMIKRFYEFFNLAVSQYGYPSKKRKFIDLFNDCFDNWDPDTIEVFFKPNKTKEKW